MSEEHVDRLREGYELSNRGDFDGVVARVHPDFVYENDPAGPLGATVYYGRGAVKRFWEDFFDTWKGLHMEPYEFREVSGGRVLVRVHMTTHVEGTEEPLRFDFTHLWTLRDDVPEHCRLYFDDAEALEAVGLSE